jgi:hypothetical protein
MILCGEIVRVRPKAIAVFFGVVNQLSAERTENAQRITE